MPIVRAIFDVEERASIHGVQSYLVMILGNTGFVLMTKEKSDEELIRLASIDDLTQIWNRRAFIMKTQAMLTQYARKNRPVSFILFDVDSFKAINDTYGHDIGDRVLVEMSAAVTDMLEPDELFGRYGGDEFALLLPGTDLDESQVKAELIRCCARRSIHECLSDIRKGKPENVFHITFRKFLKN